MQYELYHHGIKGMHWGVRRFQNLDGSLTNAGKKRYGSETPSQPKNTKSDEQKKIQAERRAKKAAMILAGVAVTAIVGYGVYKFGKGRYDYTIKANTELQRVYNRFDKVGIKDQIKPGERFYAAVKDSDKRLYKSGYFNNFLSGKENIAKIKSDSNMRIAGIKNARNMYKELVDKDPEFRKAVKDILAKDYGKDASRLSVKEQYEKFNTAMTFRDELHESAFKKFQSYAKQKGYSGVLDVNDAINNKLSKPTIIFGDETKRIIGDAKLNNKNVKKLTDLTKKYVNMKIWSNLAVDSLPTAAKYLGGYSAYMAVVGESSQKNNEREWVNQYKAKHPNTKLTNSEIINLRYNG